MQKPLYMCATWPTWPFTIKRERECCHKILEKNYNVKDILREKGRRFKPYPLRKIEGKIVVYFEKEKSDYLVRESPKVLQRS